MELQSKEIETVIKEALKRYGTGRLEHGDLDLHEAETELLDCINYCAFQILKLRRLRTKK